MTGIDLIDSERHRQIHVEGFTAEHDAEHADGELAAAALCYLANYYTGEEPFVSGEDGDPIIEWPWDRQAWKPVPQDEIRFLSKIGALIAAEIDRLLAVQAGIVTTFDTPAHVARNVLDPFTLAHLSPKQLRRRRRTGQDTARAQRRGVKAGRAFLKTPEGEARLVDTIARGVR